VKVGDLVKDKTQPEIGVGIILELHRMEPGYQGIYSGCIVMFEGIERMFVPRDCTEVVNESR